MARRRDAEVVAQLFVNVDERRREGTPSRTEKQRPCAWPEPWYGSCPRMTTRVSAYGVRWRAANTSSGDGYRVVLALRRTKACRLVQYGLVNSARSTGFQSVLAVTRSLSITVRASMLPGSLSPIDSLRVPGCAGDAADPHSSGPELPGGAAAVGEADDLTGLGAGGNKARKLEFLCAEALATGARSLVTVGAAQSNHCRMTAAAGARLGLEVHLVLSGDRPARLDGQPGVAALFGASSTSSAAPTITRASWRSPGSRSLPNWLPMGRRRGRFRSAAARRRVPSATCAYGELIDQCDHQASTRAAIVLTSSSGGTHAGLVAGRALLRAAGPEVPPMLAIGVAKGVVAGVPDITAMAREALALLGAATRWWPTTTSRLDDRWLGDEYGVPTRAGDEAIEWAARHGGWVLDRTYTGKGFSGLLGNAAAGSWSAGDDVVFVHTGGLPSVFTGLRVGPVWSGRVSEGPASLALRAVSEILEVDLLAFERGDGNQRKAVVDGVRRSLETGFVLTRHDLSEDLLDTAYAMLRQFFTAPAEEKQRWTGARCPRPDGIHRGARRDGGVERHAGLEGDAQLVDADPEPGHPLKRKFPQAYPDQVLPEETVPGSPRCSTSSTTRSPSCSGGSCASSPRASAATRRSSTRWSPTVRRSPGRSAIRRWRSPRATARALRVGRPSTATST